MARKKKNTIVISNDIVALKNWGVQYYKYIAATDEEESIPSGLLT